MSHATGFLWVSFRLLHYPKETRSVGHRCAGSHGANALRESPGNWSFRLWLYQDQVLETLVDRRKMFMKIKMLRRGVVHGAFAVLFLGASQRGAMRTCYRGKE